MAWRYCSGGRRFGPNERSAQVNTVRSKIMQKAFSVVSLLVISLFPCARATASTGAEWEGYNKSLDGERYSPLSEINTTNAGDLVEVCRIPIAKRGSFQAGLLMIRDTI